MLNWYCSHVFLVWMFENCSTCLKSGAGWFKTTFYYVMKKILYNIFVLIKIGGPPIFLFESLLVLKEWSCDHLKHKIPYSATFPIHLCCVIKSPPLRSLSVNWEVQMVAPHVLIKFLHPYDDENNATISGIV